MDQYLRLGIIGSVSLISTSYLLWLFEPNENDKSLQQRSSRKSNNKNQKQNFNDHVKNKKHNQTTQEENHQEENAEYLKGTNIVKVGDQTILDHDFVDGLLKLCKEASKKNYGAGYLDNSGEPTIILTRPEHIEKIKMTNNLNGNSENDSRDNFEICGLNKLCLAYFETSLYALLQGTLSERVRQLIMNPSGATQVSDITTRVLAVTKEMIIKLKGMIDEADLSSKTSTIDMYQIFSIFHLQCMGSVAFDADLNDLQLGGENDALKALNFLLNEIPSKALSNIDPFETTESETMFNHPAIQFLKDKLLKRKFNAAKFFYSDNTGRLSSKEVNALTYALWDIKDSVKILTIALCYLSKNRKWLSKVRLEADAVYEAQALGKEISSSDFPICEAVIKESIRMLPPDILTYRKTSKSKDVELEEGLILPKNTTVWSPILYLHHDRKNWGQDVDIWNPQRWFRGEKNTEKEVEQTTKPSAFLPFPIGTKNEQRQIGNVFVLIEAVIGLSMLAKEFDMEPCAGFEFNPVFNEQGLVSLDNSKKHLSMEVLLSRRTE